MPSFPKFPRLTLGPGLSLYLLAPVVAELMFGSSPPLIFAAFSWSHLLMYGGGAVVVRELAIRWNKGWPTIIVLGVAFGVLEQGIAQRSYFDAQAAQLTSLKDYGWFGGANWVWITTMSLYESLVSIALPILLVTLAFPDRAREPWVRSRWLRLAMLGLAGIVVLWLFLYSANVDIRLIVAAALSLELLGVVAFLLPARLPLGMSAGPAPSPVRVVATVAICVLAIFFWSISRLGPPVVPILGQICVAVALLLWIGRNRGKPDWTDRQQFAIAVGVFVCMWIYSPLVELFGGVGQLVVAGVGIWVSRRVWVTLAAENDEGGEEAETESAEDDTEAAEWAVGALPGRAVAAPVPAPVPAVEPDPVEPNPDEPEADEPTELARRKPARPKRVARRRTSAP